MNVDQLLIIEFAVAMFALLLVYILYKNKSAMGMFPAMCLLVILVAVFVPISTDINE